MAADTKAHHFQTNSTLVWVDCEMSGLNINKDKLLEVAMILTDSDLNELETLGPLIINTDKSVLDGMDEWCTKTHTKTGLVQACLKSQLTVEDVDTQLYDMLQAHNVKYGVLAGNSVSYDRLFLDKFCPKFASLLHYRIIDVSTFKEVLRRWYPAEKMFSKRTTHRALDDIRESVDELKHYKDKFFKCPSDIGSTEAVHKSIP
ncbi:Oligoribonuclease, mitochondrial [Halotydeus destructor]|nr:Oligoribonuclease, mitochondrial [Halotydeus destructor]